MAELLGWAAALGGAAGAVIATAAFREAVKNRRRHKRDWDDSYRRMSRRLASLHASNAGPRP